MIPDTVRIFVCTEPLDMRLSFDGLALAVKQRIGQDPLSGALFVFTNKRSNRLKILWYDRTGYALLYKRLHRALFHLPKSTEPGKTSINISAKELSAIIEGIKRPEKRLAFAKDNNIKMANNYIYA
jgi:transposase